MAEDAKRLLSLQMAYERELAHKFVFAGLSVNDLIYTLLCEGLGKRAEKVRADWRVPDKRYVLSSHYLFHRFPSFCLTPLFCQHAFPLRGHPSEFLGCVKLTSGSGGSRSKLLRVIRTGRVWRHLPNPRNHQLVMSLSWYVNPASDQMEESDKQTHLLSLTPPHPAEAAKFVARCDPKSRVDLYVKCGDWAKAAE